jgi:KipI family sensor histidine kinase inhibitor
MSGASGGGVTARPCGDDALLLEVPAEHVSATYVAVRALLETDSRWSARDVVPGACSVLLDGLKGAGHELVRQLQRLDTTARHQEPRVVEVPTRYDGDDLHEVARLWDMTSVEVVATHTEVEFRVAFCGFAPGFAYCTGLPERLHVPRRATPRARVPQGAVGLAGGFTGVYPSSSPGGWQLLGRTELTLWDSDAEQPATLAPGTVVRFVRVEARE